MSNPAMEVPRRHRLTVAEYYRMAEVGILARDVRVELIEGEIIDMTPIGSRHAGTVDQLVRAMQDAVADKAIVRVQSPIHLGELSEPEPDLTLLRPRADFYTTSHPRPADIILVIEVADASLGYDADIKGPLYARYGIVEYWLIDLGGQRLLRHREPASDGYRQIDEPDLRVAIPLAAAATSSVSLADLIALDGRA